MNRQTALMLNKMNAAFYAVQAQSFSATRQGAWPGWGRTANLMRARLHATNLHVSDVACGNLRFEKFLLDTLPATQFTFHAIDNCASLEAAGFHDEVTSSERATLQFTQHDIVSGLINKQPLPCEAAHLTTSFGFMHHIPGFDLRVRFLQNLCAATQPGGLIAVSLWRFMDEPQLASKARASHEAALPVLRAALGPAQLDLDENDYLLGWQEQGEYFRYCHHFSAPEIQQLIDAVEEAGAARLIDRFDADGRTGALNTYLVFQRS